MNIEVLTRISKLSGKIIVFHSIWIALLMIDFLLLLFLNRGRIIVLATIPLLIIASILFTIYINRKLKSLK